MVALVKHLLPNSILILGLFVAIILANFMLLGCKKSDEPKPKLTCDWSEDHKVIATYKDELARIEQFSSYYRVILKDRYFLACNLPEEAKVDSLKVVISGYEMWFPGIEAALLIGFPLELTKIEILE